MNEFVLDTHALVFLMYEPRRLGIQGRRVAIDDTAILLIPTMAVLEMQYLIELNKISGKIAEVIREIEQNPNMRLIAFAESELIEAVGRISTRDPFDRIIVATAQSRDIPIITRDRWIKSHYKQTIW